jgi:hypothetical protein
MSAQLTHHPFSFFPSFVCCLGFEMEREKQSIGSSAGIGKGVTSPFPIEISKRSVKAACKVGCASLKSHHTGRVGSNTVTFVDANHEE